MGKLGNITLTDKKIVLLQYLSPKMAKVLLETFYGVEKSYPGTFIMLCHYHIHNNIQKIQTKRPPDYDKICTLNIPVLFVCLSMHPHKDSLLTKIVEEIRQWKEQHEEDYLTIKEDYPIKDYCSVLEHKLKRNTE